MYTAGEGLELTDHEFRVDRDYELPQDCSIGDAVTRVSSPFSLDGDWGCRSFAEADDACPTGQFVRATDEDGDLVCAAASSTGGGVTAYADFGGFVELAGEMVIASVDLPPGKYVLFASATIRSAVLGDEATGRCHLPSFLTGHHTVEGSPNPADAESLSLTSFIDHPGGQVALTCAEIEADVDVDDAALVAIAVDSLN